MMNNNAKTGMYLSSLPSQEQSSTLPRPSSGGLRNLPKFSAAKAYGQLAFDRYQSVSATRSEDSPSNVTFQEIIRNFSEFSGLDLETMGRVLGVTRQTLYNRFKGTPAKNEEFENAFAYATEAFRKFQSAGFHRFDLVVHRKLFSGRSLLDMMLEREPIDPEIVQNLLAVDLKEQKERSLEIKIRLKEKPENISVPITER